MRVFKISSFSKRNIVDPIVFSLLLSLVSALSFHVSAKASTFATLPDWCDKPENDGLGVICGVLTSATEEADSAGNLIPNRPKENVTVAVYEENPISPTGQLDGYLTNLFSSTATNAQGRFRVTMRKVGPPNVKVHLVFLCQNAVVGHRDITTYEDTWVQEQVNCDTTYPIEYKLPATPLRYADRANMLGCFVDGNKTTVVGTEKNEYITVNDPIQEQNYDHRFTKNTVTLSTPIPLLNSSFESPGGFWEPDCLLRGDRYICNVTECTRDAADAPDYENSPMQPAGKSPLNFYDRDIDGTLCPAEEQPMLRADYLTRPFLRYIPKSGEGEPFRRFDVRANIENYLIDPLAAMQWNCKLFGCTAGAPISPYVYIRKYMEPDNTDPELSRDQAIDIKELKKRNNPTQEKKGSERNKYINNGPIGGLASPATDWNALLFSGMVDISKPVAQDKETREYIRLCEIQPPWSPFNLCEVGNENCRNDRLQQLLTESRERVTAALGSLPSCNPEVTSCPTAVIELSKALDNIDSSLENCNGAYKLDASYFPMEQIFKAGQTMLSIMSETQNDSYTSVSGVKTELHKLYESESGGGTGGPPHATRSYEPMESGGRYLEPNSFNSSYCMINPEECVGIENESLQGLTDPLTIPFADFNEDYYKQAEGRISGDYGPNLIPACGVPSLYEKITTTAQEADSETFNPDNIFSDNNQHARHKAVGTATWYFSEDALERDRLLKLRTDIGIPYTGYYGIGTSSSIINGALGIMIWRDVWDSLLTINSGDTNLHNMNFNLTDVIQTFNEASLNTNADYKTFGDREDILGTPVPKPYYKVEYALNDVNFPALFPLPDPEAGATDEEALTPAMWGTPGHVCYPFTTAVPEGQICGTFREGVAALSRTCRLDECRAFWRYRTGQCTCRSPNGPCEIEDEQEGETSDLCTRYEKMDCAVNQETTERLHSEDENNIHYLEPIDLHTSPYDPPSLDEEDCIPGNINDWYDENGVWDGQPRSYDMGGDGPHDLRCDMTVAGPMVNTGEGCNGSIEVGDAAIRMRESAPPIAGSNIPRETYTLDEMAKVAHKVYAAVKPPYIITTFNIKKSVLDGNITNSESPSRFSNGAAKTGIGGGPMADIGVVSTAPTFGSINNDDIHKLSYHCDLDNSYTPGDNEDLVFDPYDPDLDGTPGWVCKIYSPPSPTEANIEDLSNGCTISQSRLASCGQAIDRIPNTLSESFRRTINLAATQANIPAAALLAILYNEGGFYGDYHPLWADQDIVKSWGTPWYGRMDMGGPATCNDLVWSSQGPFQILLSTFKSFKASGPYCSLLNGISPGRCISASRCNFLDAALMAAVHMQNGGTCGNFDFVTAMNSYSGGSVTYEGDMGTLETVYNTCR